MQSKEQKQALRNEASLNDVMTVDGVLVGVPYGISDEAREELVAYVQDQINDPQSELSRKRDAAAARRVAFDKRRALAREAALAEAAGEGNKEGHDNGKTFR